MNDLFVGIEHRSTISGGFIEALCETLIALTIAAAICVAMISLSVHLNQAGIARASAPNTTQAVATTVLPVAAKDAASQFN